ncbi:MAG: dihydrofolate reductase [Pelagibacteraceae bacterium]|nr:dihydrofolate reductase [Pelagibacteraceae bacterium]MBT6198283.1 dihydrofolate reductase [Pelagibacteraceae bacterium]
MIKAIMATDDQGGVSRGASMPWPKNSNDLQWFKKNTLSQVVIMGSKTWEDPFMPTPLKHRTNILITNKNKSYYPGADKYINGDIVNEINNLEKEYINKDIFIIGGPEIINQCFDLFKEFYLTRIYGNFECEKFIDLDQIEKKMRLSEKINSDETCHFEIWKK